MNVLEDCSNRKKTAFVAREQRNMQCSRKNVEKIANEKCTRVKTDGETGRPNVDSKTQQGKRLKIEREEKINYRDGYNSENACFNRYIEKDCKKTNVVTNFCSDDDNIYRVLPRSHKVISSGRFDQGDSDNADDTNDEYSYMTLEPRVTWSENELYRLPVVTQSNGEGGLVKAKRVDASGIREDGTSVSESEENRTHLNKNKDLQLGDVPSQQLHNTTWTVCSDRKQTETNKLVQGRSVVNCVKVIRANCKETTLSFGRIKTLKNNKQEVSAEKYTTAHHLHENSINKHTEKYAKVSDVSALCSENVSNRYVNRRSDYLYQKTKQRDSRGRWSVDNETKYFPDLGTTLTDRENNTKKDFRYDAPIIEYSENDLIFKNETNGKAQGEVLDQGAVTKQSKVTRPSESILNEIVRVCGNENCDINGVTDQNFIEPSDLSGGSSPLNKTDHCLILAYRASKTNESRNEKPHQTVVPEEKFIGELFERGNGVGISIFSYDACNSKSHTMGDKPLGNVEDCASKEHEICKTGRSRESSSNLIQNARARTASKNSTCKTDGTIPSNKKGRDVGKNASLTIRHDNPRTDDIKKLLVKDRAAPITRAKKNWDNLAIGAYKAGARATQSGIVMAGMQNRKCKSTEEKNVSNNNGPPSSSRGRETLSKIVSTVESNMKNSETSNNNNTSSQSLNKKMFEVVQRDSMNNTTAVVSPEIKVTAIGSMQPIRPDNAVENTCSQNIFGEQTTLAMSPVVDRPTICIIIDKSSEKDSTEPAMLTEVIDGETDVNQNVNYSSNWFGPNSTGSTTNDELEHMGMSIKTYVESHPFTSSSVDDQSLNNQSAVYSVGRVTGRPDNCQGFSSAVTANGETERKVILDTEGNYLPESVSSVYYEAIQTPLQEAHPLGINHENEIVYQRENTTRDDKLTRCDIHEYASTQHTKENVKLKVAKNGEKVGAAVEGSSEYCSRREREGKHKSASVVKPVIRPKDGTASAIIRGKWKDIADRNNKKTKKGSVETIKCKSDVKNERNNARPHDPKVQLKWYAIVDKTKRELSKRNVNSKDSNGNCSVRTTDAKDSRTTVARAVASKSLSNSSLNSTNAKKHWMRLSENVKHSKERLPMITTCTNKPDNTPIKENQDTQDVTDSKNKSLNTVKKETIIASKSLSNSSLNSTHGKKHLTKLSEKVNDSNEPKNITRTDKPGSTLIKKIRDTSGEVKTDSKNKCEKKKVNLGNTARQKWQTLAGKAAGQDVTRNAIVRSENRNKNMALRNVTFGNETSNNTNFLRVDIEHNNMPKQSKTRNKSHDQFERKDTDAVRELNIGTVYGKHVSKSRETEQSVSSGIESSSKRTISKQKEKFGDIVKKVMVQEGLGATNSKKSSIPLPTFKTQTLSPRCSRQSSPRLRSHSNPRLSVSPSPNNRGNGTVGCSNVSLLHNGIKEPEGHAKSRIPRLSPTPFRKNSSRPCSPYVADSSPEKRSPKSIPTIKLNRQSSLWSRAITAAKNDSNPPKVSRTEQSSSVGGVRIKSQNDKFSRQQSPIMKSQTNSEEKKSKVSVAPRKVGSSSLSRVDTHTLKVNSSHRNNRTPSPVGSLSPSPSVDSKAVKSTLDRLQKMPSKVPSIRVSNTAIHSKDSRRLATARPNVLGTRVSLHVPDRPTIAFSAKCQSGASRSRSSSPFKDQPHARPSSPRNKLKKNIPKTKLTSDKNSKMSPKLHNKSNTAAKFTFEDLVMIAQNIPPKYPDKQKSRVSFKQAAKCVIQQNRTHSKNKTSDDTKYDSNAEQFEMLNRSFMELLSEKKSRDSCTNSENGESKVKTDHEDKTSIALMSKQIVSKQKTQDGSDIDNIGRKPTNNLDSLQTEASKCSVECEFNSFLTEHGDSLYEKLQADSNIMLNSFKACLETEITDCLETESMPTKKESCQTATDYEKSTDALNQQKYNDTPHLLNTDIEESDDLTEYGNTPGNCDNTEPIPKVNDTLNERECNSLDTHAAHRDDTEERSIENEVCELLVSDIVYVPTNGGQTRSTGKDSDRSLSISPQFKNITRSQNICDKESTEHIYSCAAAGSTDSITLSEWGGKENLKSTNSTQYVARINQKDEVDSSMAANEELARNAFLITASNGKCTNRESDVRPEESAPGFNYNNHLHERGGNGQTKQPPMGVGDKSGNSHSKCTDDTQNMETLVCDDCDDQSIATSRSGISNISKRTDRHHEEKYVGLTAQSDTLNTGMPHYKYSDNKHDTESKILDGLHQNKAGTVHISKSTEPVNKSFSRKNSVSDIYEQNILISQKKSETKDQFRGHKGVLLAAKKFMSLKKDPNIKYPFEKNGGRGQGSADSRDNISVSYRERARQRSTNLETEVLLHQVKSENVIKDSDIPTSVIRTTADEHTSRCKKSHSLELENAMSKCTEFGKRNQFDKRLDLEKKQDSSSRTASVVEKTNSSVQLNTATIQNLKTDSETASVKQCFHPTIVDNIDYAVIPNREFSTSISINDDVCDITTEMDENVLTETDDWTVSVNIQLDNANDDLAEESVSNADDITECTLSDSSPNDKQAINDIALDTLSGRVVGCLDSHQRETESNIYVVSYINDSTAATKKLGVELEQDVKKAEIQFRNSSSEKKQVDVDSQEDENRSMRKSSNLSLGNISVKNSTSSVRETRNLVGSEGTTASVYQDNRLDSNDGRNSLESLVGDSQGCVIKQRLNLSPGNGRTHIQLNHMSEEDTMPSKSERESFDSSRVNPRNGYTPENVICSIQEETERIGQEQSVGPLQSDQLSTNFISAKKVDCVVLEGSKVALEADVNIVIQSTNISQSEMTQTSMERANMILIDQGCDIPQTDHTDSVFVDNVYHVSSETTIESSKEDINTEVSGILNITRSKSNTVEKGKQEYDKKSSEVDLSRNSLSRNEVAKVDTILRSKQDEITGLEQTILRIPPNVEDLTNLAASPAMVACCVVNTSASILPEADTLQTTSDFIIQDMKVTGSFQHSPKRWIPTIDSSSEKDGIPEDEKRVCGISQNENRLNTTFVLSDAVECREQSIDTCPNKHQKSPKVTDAGEQSDEERSDNFAGTPRALAMDLTKIQTLFVSKTNESSNTLNTSTEKKPLGRGLKRFTAAVNKVQKSIADEKAKIEEVTGKKTGYKFGKVSEICKVLLEKAKQSKAQKANSADPNGIECSPPKRKMTWMREGKSWIRIPFNQSTDGGMSNNLNAGGKFWQRALTADKQKKSEGVECKNQTVSRDSENEGTLQKSQTWGKTTATATKSLPMQPDVQSQKKEIQQTFKTMLMQASNDLQPLPVETPPNKQEEKGDESEDIARKIESRNNCEPMFSERSTGDIHQVEKQETSETSTERKSCICKYINATDTKVIEQNGELKEGDSCNENQHNVFGKISAAMERKDKTPAGINVLGTNTTKMTNCTDACENDGLDQKEYGSVNTIVLNSKSVVQDEVPTEDSLTKQMCYAKHNDIESSLAEMKNDIEIQPLVKQEALTADDVSVEIPAALLSSGKTTEQNEEHVLEVVSENIEIHDISIEIPAPLSSGESTQQNEELDLQDDIGMHDVAIKIPALLGPEESTEQNEELVLQDDIKMHDVSIKIPALLSSEENTEQNGKQTLQVVSDDIEIHDISIEIPTFLSSEESTEQNEELVLHDDIKMHDVSIKIPALLSSEENTEQNGKQTLQVVSDDIEVHDISIEIPTFLSFGERTEQNVKLVVQDDIEMHDVVIEIPTFLSSEENTEQNEELVSQVASEIDVNQLRVGMCDDMEHKFINYIYTQHVEEQFITYDIETGQCCSKIQIMDADTDSDGENILCYSLGKYSTHGNNSLSIKRELEIATMSENQDSTLGSNFCNRDMEILIDSKDGSRETAEKQMADSISNQLGSFNENNQTTKPTEEKQHVPCGSLISGNVSDVEPPFTISMFEGEPLTTINSLEYLSDCYEGHNEFSSGNHQPTECLSPNATDYQIPIVEPRKTKSRPISRYDIMDLFEPDLLTEGPLKTRSKSEERAPPQMNLQLVPIVLRSSLGERIELSKDCVQTTGTVEANLRSDDISPIADNVTTHQSNNPSQQLREKSREAGEIVWDLYDCPGDTTEREACQDKDNEHAPISHRGDEHELELTSGSGQTTASGIVHDSEVDITQNFCKRKNHVDMNTNCQITAAESGLSSIIGNTNQPDMVVDLSRCEEDDFALKRFSLEETSIPLQPDSALINTSVALLTAQTHTQEEEELFQGDVMFLGSETYEPIVANECTVLATMKLEVGRCVQLSNDVTTYVSSTCSSQSVLGETQTNEKLDSPRYHQNSKTSSENENTVEALSFHTDPASGGLFQNHCSVENTETTSCVEENEKRCHGKLDETTQAVPIIFINESRMDGDYCLKPALVSKCVSDMSEMEDVPTEQCIQRVSAPIRLRAIKIKEEVFPKEEAEDESGSNSTEPPAVFSCILNEPELLQELPHEEMHSETLPKNNKFENVLRREDIHGNRPVETFSIFNKPGDISSGENQNTIDKTYLMTKGENVPTEQRVSLDNNEECVREGKTHNKTDRWLISGRQLSMPESSCSLNESNGGSTMLNVEKNSMGGYWNASKNTCPVYSVELQKESEQTGLLTGITEVEENSGGWTTSKKNVYEQGANKKPCSIPPQNVNVNKQFKRRLSLQVNDLSCDNLKVSYADGHFSIGENHQRSIATQKAQNGKFRKSKSETDTAEEKNVKNKKPKAKVNEDNDLVITKNESHEDWKTENVMEVFPTLINMKDTSEQMGEVFIDSDYSEVAFLHDEDFEESENPPLRHVYIPRRSRSPSARTSASENIGCRLPRSASVDHGIFRSDRIDHPQVTKLDTGHGLTKLKRSSSFRDAIDKDPIESSVLSRRSSSFRETSNNPDELGLCLKYRSGVQCEDTVSLSRPKSPGFFQRMISRRSSFNEKNLKSTKSTESFKEMVKKMSLKGIFKKSKSESSQKPISEQRSPPLAAFQSDEDIHNVGTNGSAYTSHTLPRRHTSADIFSQAFANASTLPKRKHADCPKRLISEDQISVQSLNIHSQHGQQPQRPISPKPVGLSPSKRFSSQSIQNVYSLTKDLNNHSQYDLNRFTHKCEKVLKIDSSEEMELEYGGDVYPKKTKDITDGRVGDAISSPEKYSALVQSEMTSSNSNDSGIQHDASVHSSNESLKVTSDAMVTVKRRKSPSPRHERPKSEISVRWADLEEAAHVIKIKRREGNEIAKDRPRPKSDLGVSSLESDGLKALSCESNRLPYASMSNLEELRRKDQQKSNKPSKLRRMSTPHPIKSRLENSPPKQRRRQQIIRSHSMPENLDKIPVQKFGTIFGIDLQMDPLTPGPDDDDSSDESMFSLDHGLKESRSLSAHSSRIQLTTLDEMPEEEENLTFAEALWDHITMDPEELGFRAGDLIQVIYMSDKDWWWGALEEREGWFPATFVRLRVNQDQFEEDLTKRLEEDILSSPKLRRMSVINKDQARANVVNEIINAEREYVTHLRDVVDGYIRHARRRSDMFPEDRILRIFGNIESIYHFSSKFLSRLENCINSSAPHLSELGKCFIEQRRGFEIYSDYCNNHPSACDELKELYGNRKFKHFFEACRLLQEMIEIPLEGFLLTPVQKICKYPLQLAELLKFTPPKHPDSLKVKEALEAMKKIAALINERKRKMESIEKLAVWQQSVEDWEGCDLLDASSELIYSNEANKINSSGWSQERYFFLFDHQLIYCKKDLLKRNAFCYKGRVDLDQCEVLSIEDGKDTQYSVNVRNAWKLHEIQKDKWYLLYAKTPAAKQRWLKAFQDERQRVLEDQENEFQIPVHWKVNAMKKLKLQTQKEKQQRTGIVPLNYMLKDIPAHATLPRTNNSHQDKKKSWFNFGKKTKR
ncbi:hypothetical protein ScPMuIL_017848 [Solemya velum]